MHLRSAILELLTVQQADALVTAEGKKALKEAIKARSLADLHASEGDRCPLLRIRRPVLSPRAPRSSRLGWVMDVPCPVDFVLGIDDREGPRLRAVRARLDRRARQAAGADLEVRVGGVPVATGEVVIVDESVGAAAQPDSPARRNGSARDAVRLASPRPGAAGPSPGPTSAADLAHARRTARRAGAARPASPGCCKRGVLVSPRPQRLERRVGAAAGRPALARGRHRRESAAAARDLRPVRSRSSPSCCRRRRSSTPSIAPRRAVRHSGGAVVTRSCRTVLLVARCLSRRRPPSRRRDAARTALRGTSPAQACRRQSPRRARDAARARGHGRDAPRDLNLQIDGLGTVSAPLQIVVLLTLLTFIPAALVMMTSFTRIAIVFHFLRQAHRHAGDAVEPDGHRPDAVSDGVHHGADRRAASTSWRFSRRSPARST